MDRAVRSIHASKSLGVDGFNYYFYQKTWHLVRHDIVQACLAFFKYGKLLRSVNYTSISLIPKVQNPTHVKDYRPIACSNVLYKILAKIMAARMQESVYSVISLSQSGFVPGRQLLENVLLTSESIKGYGHKNISPRCMIKIDLRKAYDSIEWPFRESMMRGLGYHDQFMKWVMEGIRTVSYSILINGRPAEPF